MTETPAPHRWLLLIHQLPSEPSKLRVKAWRRLQGAGALLLKNSVYLLPNRDQTREDFEWIRTEIVAQGGEATVFQVDAADDLTDQELEDAFRSARQEDWHALRQRAADLGQRLGSDGDEQPAPEPTARELRALRSDAARIDKIDFFAAVGRNEAVAEIARVEHAWRPAPATRPAARASREVRDYRRRRWLTRPRPGVDRMASAWLIRRFIDPDATFRFAERLPQGDDLVPFDMFGAELGHRGEMCTFETVMAEFGLDDRSLQRIGRIVHDLDLRAGETEPETATVGRIVEGLRSTDAEDAEVLERGMAVFEALYRSFGSDPTGD